MRCRHGSATSYGKVGTKTTLRFQWFCLDGREKLLVLDFIINIESQVRGFVVLFCESNEITQCVFHFIFVTLKSTYLRRNEAMPSYKWNICTILRLARDIMFPLLVTRFAFNNTLRPRQMDAISQTTFSNAFSWLKMFEFRLKFHWSLFLRVQLTIFQHWFR